MQNTTNIIEQIQQGNKKVFENLFNSYYSYLCAYANKFVLDKDIAEEIVQELFYQIWIKRENLQIKTSLKSYLFRAVHNSCLNYIKHKNIQNKYHEEVLKDLQEEHSETYDTLENVELQNKIRLAIDKLPTERKKIFLMIRFENLKYIQVAKKLNISIKTVENQMGSALRFLREELKDYLPILIFIIIYLNLNRGYYLFNCHI